MSDSALKSPLGLREPAGTTQEPLRNQLGTAGEEGGSRAPLSRKGEGPDRPGTGTDRENPARITLPWSVLVPDNQRHGLMRGRILLTAKYRDALAGASTLAAFQWKAGPLKTSVAVRVTLYEPDKRRRDIGNYTKLIADALTRVAFVDDSQIDELRLSRGGLDRKNPRAEVEIAPL